MARRGKGEGSITLIVKFEHKVLKLTAYELSGSLSQVYFVSSQAIGVAIVSEDDTNFSTIGAAVNSGFGIYNQVSTYVPFSFAYHQTYHTTSNSILPSTKIVVT